MNSSIQKSLPFADHAATWGFWIAVVSATSLGLVTLAAILYKLFAPMGLNEYDPLYILLNVLVFPLSLVWIVTWPIAAVLSAVALWKANTSTAPAKLYRKALLTLAVAAISAIV